MPPPYATPPGILWAPWRNAYLRRSGPRRCIFCEAVTRGPRADRATQVVYRGREVFAILNRYPYNNGHLMVVPYRHVGTLAQVRASEHAELWQVITRMTEELTGLIRPQGFNIGVNIGRAAGAGILGHLHFHVVPRWLGDTNFMTAAGHTKVISESLDELHRQLTARLRRRPR
ncbi:MAG: HIT domain-containing protein [Candidatus Omnitrophica bacterium]|nr:HIT domain-containing protein [Candidatus Omnitrophota bacterium]